VVSTTVVWGSTEWNHEVTKIGTAATKEEVRDKAAEHGADSFVTYSDELETHKIEEFLNADE
jgi:NADPH:quinone reductase-like Zn-dependent oxidoreductase